MFARTQRMLARWYVSAPLAVGLGALASVLVFFYLFPGRPEIAIIDVPFTPLEADSAAFIGDMLDYAHRTPSIRAVVVKLDSPGGEVTSSDQLFLKMLRLREDKPVVVAIGSTAASGGYLMALGANYTYAKPTSFVGSVGVVLDTDRPRGPDEGLITSGPAKLPGATQRTYNRMVEMIKESFIQTVIAERGRRLQVERDELAEGRLYLGMEAVGLGLVDAIGTDTEALEKAADLAGVSHYGLVDVNERVLSQCNEKLRRVLSATSDSDGELRQLPGIACSGLLAPPAEGQRRPLLSPGFPIDVNLPKMYYLHVAPSD